VSRERAAARVNYRWWAEGTAGGICETTEAADSNPWVLATFSEARAALSEHFHAMETKAGDARWSARNLRKADMKDGECSV
jgi:hypothetical protein